MELTTLHFYNFAIFYQFFLLNWTYMWTHITEDMKYTFFDILWNKSKKNVNDKKRIRKQLGSEIYWTLSICITIINETTHSFLYFFYNVLHVATTVAGGLWTLTGRALMCACNQPHPGCQLPALISNTRYLVPGITTTAIFTRYLVFQQFARHVKRAATVIWLLCHKKT